MPGDPLSYAQAGSVLLFHHCLASVLTAPASRPPHHLVQEEARRGNRASASSLQSRGNIAHTPPPGGRLVRKGSLGYKTPATPGASGPRKWCSSLGRSSPPTCFVVIEERTCLRDRTGRPVFTTKRRFSQKPDGVISLEVLPYTDTLKRKLRVFIL